MADHKTLQDNIQHGIDNDPNHDAEKGAALGGMGGAVVGAAAGSVTGPIGMVIGAAAGGLLGAVSGGLTVGAVDEVDNDDTVTGLGAGTESDTSTDGDRRERSDRRSEEDRRTEENRRQAQDRRDEGYESAPPNNLTPSSSMGSEQLTPGSHAPVPLPFGETLEDAELQNSSAGALHTPVSNGVVPLPSWEPGTQNTKTWEQYPQDSLPPEATHIMTEDNDIQEDPSYVPDHHAEDRPKGSFGDNSRPVTHGHQTQGATPEEPPLTANADPETRHKSAGFTLPME